MKIVNDNGGTIGLRREKGGEDRVEIVTLEVSLSAAEFLCKILREQLYSGCT